MNMSNDQTYRVVLNHEEQYSIWLSGRDLPPGWHADGFEGSKEECLAHIDEVWTDMRPASLRRRMEALEPTPVLTGTTR
jgi:MbtH protein